MKVLIIGSGGREHAIAKKCKESPHLSALYTAPGNPGTASLGKNLPIKENNHSELIQAAKDLSITLVIIGPEAPLAEGLADKMREEDIPVLGPGKEAAQLEGSKEWAKALMKKYQIPTADSESFSDFDSAKQYLLNKDSYPIVIKADGLAAGKGVTVAETERKAIAALEDCFINKAFKEAGDKVLIEEFLPGEEASIFAFCDGKSILPMVPAQDHKAVFDGDKGPNTGGMGAYSPTPLINSALEDEIKKTVFEPLLHAFQSEGIDYKGILFAGLMIDENNRVNVIEFNVRFGDPETQVVLPRLKTDILEIADAIINERLDSIQLQWSDSASVCVVMASGGYPGNIVTQLPISGLDKASEIKNVSVIQAGTTMDGDTLKTSGGRVLSVVATSKDLAEAVKEAYAAVEHIQFKNAHYRTDIAAKAFKHA